MALVTDFIKLLLDRREFFWQLFWEHIALCCLAIGATLVIGIALAILMTRSPGLAKIVLFVTGFLYTIPSIALFGFFIAISGIGNKTAIIVLIIYGILPMVRNTYIGLEEVDPKIVEAAVAMGSNFRELLFKIKLPLALPVIFTGIRTMVIMIVSLTSIASFIGAGGLGVAIYRGINSYNPMLTFSGSLLVALLALCFDQLIGLLEKKVCYKSKRKQEIKPDNKNNNITV